MSSSIKTLAEVVATAPGSFISGGFQAVVTNPKSIVSKKSGKTFYKATLTEGGAKVDATSFTTDFAPLAGKLTKWIGMGIARGDDYNGTAQVTIGDKARWIPVGDSPEGSSPAPTSLGAPQAPVPANSSRIDGQTVGMTMKAAVDLCIARAGALGTFPDLDSIYNTASGLIRLSAKLQAGELAPENTDKTEDVPY